MGNTTKMTRAINAIPCMLLLSALCNCLYGQQDVNSIGKIEFPDIPGYKTLVCDFHQHTVFSDGLVWPIVRVNEAMLDGLDAISITDHIEYQPNSEYIPNTDLNVSYNLAQEAAKNSQVLVIRGAEITREMPPGHANALFLKDINKLADLDSMQVFREAKAQEAFVIWNHPHWYAQNPNGTAVLTKMHKQLIKEKLIHAVEIVNEHSYSDEALKIALDNKLAIVSGSDIHDLIQWQFNTQSGDHRPVTLVFAKEKSEESIKEALFKGRTMVWFNNTLIGLPEYVEAIVKQSLVIKRTRILDSYNGTSNVVEVIIENKSDADFIIENQKAFSLYDHAAIFTLKGKSENTIQVKMLKELKNFTMQFRILNAITAPNVHPVISLNVYTVQN